ncbi:MAG: TonB-dependent receptor [Bacteroidia bacterium]|nr:TonB-dependent receptor [Bacteroidia bacterium]
MRKKWSEFRSLLKKYLMLFFMFAFSVQFIIAQRNISGTITNSADNTPLPGVNIVEKGTTNGTATDPAGKYNITVSQNAVLVISFIGMRTQEIKVEDKSVIDISLVEDAMGLDEVVVVGYGSSKKSDLTGTIVSLNTKEINATPIISMEQSMNGRLAGVQVTEASHAPGGGITVRIRGGNSINSNIEPLYVIDGFPVYSNNNQIPNNGPDDGVMPQMNLLAGINPGDIERIEVLKDGSSTAIYGARGANGVVLITTKRGSAGAPKIEYSTYYAFEKIAKKLDMLDAYQFATLYNEQAVNQGQAPLFTGQTVDGVYYGTPEEYKSPFNPNTSGIDTLPSTDWQETVLRTGFIMNHQLSMTGGSTNTQYALSLGHLKHNGIIIGGDYTRTSIRTNLDSKVTKWLSVGSSITYSHNVSNNSGSETGLQWFNGGTISAALKSWPMFPAYNEDGSINTAVGNKSLKGNPIAYAKDAKNVLYNKRMLGNIFGTITFMKGLSLRVSAGADINDINRNRYFPRTTYEGSLVNGSASKSYTSTYSWLNENILTYDKTFGVHKINFIAGFTMQKEVSEGSSLSASDFPSDIFQDNNMSAGANQTSASYSWKSQWSMASYIARLNYNLKDKYLFTLTGRADGSSKFGADNQWAFFPSFAVAWRLSQEPFIQNLNVFDQLKLKFSVGQTGNSEIGIYQSQSLLGMQNYTFGEGVLSPGVGPTRMANPELRWETTTQYDGGLEVGLLQGRLSFTFDYYYKKTTDLLLSANLPGTSGYLPPLLGFSLPPQNMGSLENKGGEFTLNYDVFTGPFKWKISGNIYWNRNKILDLGPRGAFTLQSPNDLDKHGGRVYVDVGLPVGVWRRTIYDGIFNDQAEVDAYVNKDGDPIQPGAEPGDVKYVDVNGDGIFDGKDLDIAGDPNPDFLFGVTNEFSYKNLSLSIFINGSQGNDINYPTYVHAMETHMAAGNCFAELWNRWTPTNTNTNVPKMGATYVWGDDMIFDGSYVRIKNVRLSYTVPTGKISFLKSAVVYVNVSNLFTFTDYPGYDPEVNSAGQSSWQRGIDLNAFPATRSFMFGIQVGF